MEQELINKFHTIYTNIVTEKGNTYLFMVVKMDEYVDKWSVVVSASWISRENQREEFTYLARKMGEILTPEELLTVARIGIFQPDEHIVQLFNSTFRVQGGSNVRLSNNTI